MPPKQRYTKEMVLQAAYKITKECGFEAVNSHSLAQELGCSTQPIYSYFATMDALKMEVYEMATAQFMAAVNAHQDEADFFNTATKMFLLTAKNDSHLFRLIYHSHSFDGKSLPELLSQYETNRLIFEKLMSDYGLSVSQAQTLFYKIWFFIYGIATMLATNKLAILDAEVFDLVGDTVGELIRNATREETII